MSAEMPAHGRAPRGARRRRRLRRAAAVLASLAVVAAIAAVLVVRERRPQAHRPGEEMEGVTERLSKDLPADAPAPRWTDVTAQAGLSGFRTFNGERTSQLPEDMGSGAAWGDFDNDGDDDLFLVSAGGSLDLPAAERAPSVLYENRGDGTFRRWPGFPDLRILGMGAAWGDYDGDGWLDLAVSGYGTLQLFHNERGTFVADPSFPNLPGYWAGVSWGDFDNDRDLDLYVCGYVRYVPPDGSRAGSSTQYGAAVPYTLNPTSFEPERNLLFRNDGGGRFTEVAAKLGVDNPKGRSLTALWHDFDDDGWLDLYVANDISDNALFLNRGGRFEDASLAAWVADYRGAMGLAAGDWNRDGDDDLFITHWIAQENALYDSLLNDLPAAASRAPGAAVAPAAQGKKDARARLGFTDLAAPLGLGQIALRFVGWGTEFADLDGDGWLDLVVANGSTLEADAQTPGAPRRLKPQEALLLWNRRGEHFYDLAPFNKALAEPHVSRGLALSDYDGDGDLDLLIVHLGEGVQLLRNDMQTGHWVELRLRSRLPRRGGKAAPEVWGHGEGATVVAHVGGALLRRSVTDASYLSQSTRTVHLGLGDATRVDRLEVRWLGGGTEEFSNLPADTVWELTEGDPTPRRLGPRSPEATAGAETAAGAPPEALTDRERTARFWKIQRAAMDAMKRDGDLPRAIALFRQALALDPSHEDARYYLGTSLAVEGQVEEGLAELATLARLNPQSHRAWKEWAALRALHARSPADLAAAQQAAAKALALNPEETGSLLLLGEIALLRGDSATAVHRLELACRTNPKAVGGFYLRGYVAWRRGDSARARELLEAAKAARGEEWKPEGTAAEGDVARTMHREETPLSRFWRGWDGSLEPAAAYRSLAAALDHPPGPAGATSAGK